MFKRYKLPLKFLNNAIFRKKYPFVLNFAITYRCNSKCSYCNFWRMDGRELATKEIFSIVDQIEDDCFYINLYGGEPLLREDFGEIVDYIQNKEKIFLSLISNGKLIPKKIGAVKKADLVILSLDGPKEVNDKLRGAGSFDAVEKAIPLLAKHNVPVAVNVTLSNLNLKYVPYMLDFAKDRNIRISFNVYRKVNDSMLTPRVDDFRKAIDQILDYPHDIFTYSKEMYKRYRQWPDWGEWRCTSGKDFLYIDPYGNMFPCTIQAEKFAGDSYLKNGPDRVRWNHNVLRSDVMDCFDNLDLSNCLKCWACDRIEVSDVMNHKLKLIRYLKDTFDKDAFLRKNITLAK